MAIGNIFANKIVLSTLNVLLYGGGGGGVVGGVLGLGGEAADIARTEEVYEPEIIHIRRSLRVKRSPTQSDRHFYTNNPKYEAVAGTKLPKGLVESHIYQAEASDALEKNDVNFYCTNLTLNSKIVGNEEKDRGDLDTDIIKSYQGEHNSCVNVMGHREYYGNQKGRGALKIFQVVDSRQYGSMILTTITADKGQLTVDGINYTLQKAFLGDGQDKNNFQGEIKGGKKKEAEVLTEQNKDRLLILPGEALQKKQENGGFEFGTDNICRQGECYGNAEKAEYSNRLGKGSQPEANRKRQALTPGKKSMKEGSSNFDSGTATDGMFPGYDGYFHQSFIGYLKLEIDNTETIE